MEREYLSGHVGVVTDINDFIFHNQGINWCIAAAVASALFTRRFRFIGVLARVGFRVLAISVHTFTTQVARESTAFALARAAREVDRVQDSAPTPIPATFTGVGRFVRVPTSLGTISIL